jgi:putative N6-adenine-specific DNA methylase
MIDTITLIATASFGLETPVKYEVMDLGFAEPRVSHGRVEFDAAPADIPRANLWLRCADRVLLKMGAFTAVTFDQLFEQTTALPWEHLIPENGAFPVVSATSVNSKLHHTPTCQSIVKKAVVERLKEKYGIDWFPETGPTFPIQVTIHKDEVLLAVDTSGDGLHKRGYRREAGEAPLQETLAAGLVQLSFWKKGRRLIDPLCGAGTILIEAAMIGRNIAPGLKRPFVSEEWPLFAAGAWREARQSAIAAQDRAGEMALFGYDIDAAAIAMARRNAERAGVADEIQFEQKPIQDVWIDRQYGIVITNPPYGERMGDYREINKIYRTLHKMFRKKSGWSVYVLTADKKFPDFFGGGAHRSRPNKVRKLYNGRIEVNYYQYYGEKPPDA